MKEELLHFVWRYRYYDAQGLRTTDGRPIRIIFGGQANTNAGPDFLQAHIRLDDQDWYGQIEIHLRASDWDRHQHSGDPAYQNVILHVVHHCDQEIKYSDGTKIPCVELQGRIPLHIFRNYEKLLMRMDWIPCAGNLQGIKPITALSWMERLTIERLAIKTERIHHLYRQNQQNWEETLYQWLAYGFGLRLNSESFLKLAHRLPLKIIAKYRHQDKLIQALYYGAADMLSNKPVDDFTSLLQKEYRYLSKKHRIECNTAILWKFHRMRPNGFPTIRLSQFIRFVQKHPSLVSTIIEQTELKQLLKMFDIEAHIYWSDHSKFGQSTKKTKKRVGQAFKSQLFINVIVPFLFFYGLMTGEQRYKDRAVEWLQQIKAEKNSLMKQWSDEGIRPAHAADTQALYHLKTQYCDSRKCLECSFGHLLIKER